MQLLTEKILRLSPVFIGFSLGLYLSIFPACTARKNPSVLLEKRFALEGGAGLPFLSPGGIATDDGGNIYVADSGNCRIVVFDSQGGYLRFFGSKGRGPGEFISPWRLSVFKNTLYVYDWNRNIQKFSLQGQFQSGFNLRGALALDFVIDSDGNIYVGKWATHEDQFLIEKYDNNGRFLQSFGKPLSGPSRPLTLISNNFVLCKDSRDYIYIAFRYINLIRIYDTQGSLVKEFARRLDYTPRKPVHTPEDEKPFDVDGVTGGIFCESDGNIFIISNKEFNQSGHLIDVLSQDGDLLTGFYSGYLGEELPPYSELRRDQSIFLDQTGRLFLLDQGAMSIHVFKLTFVQPGGSSR